MDVIAIVIHMSDGSKVILKMTCGRRLWLLGWDFAIVTFLRIETNLTNIPFNNCPYGLMVKRITSTI